MTSLSAKRHRTREHGRRVARLLTTVSALGLFASGAIANPEGGSVVAGTATIVETAPGNLEIHQTTDQAIINWQSFSIGAAERTHFAQPSASAIALNRVTGGDPSHILGRLSATGQIVLVNPNGVFFGANSTVDVAGLVATTSDVRNQDFMAGRLKFLQPGRPGATIVNRGQISVRDGGLAALVAPGVENSGEIVARLGSVTLAGSDRFTVDLFGDGLINLSVGEATTSELVAADGQILTAIVVNSGRLVADGGQVILTAAAARDIVDRTINMDGVIEARSFVQQEGRITLFGGATGEVRVAGALDASGVDAARGGRIDVFGEDIILAAGATLDTSGDTGGGSIRVGGDYRGQVSAPVSTVTEIRAGATIRADSTNTGDGGRIILWSDGSTSYYGTASARGGAAGGDGGFVEVSGKQHLTFAGDVDTRAPTGRTGQLLLDPTSVDICRSCTTGGAGTPSSQLNVDDLVANLNSNNVTVSTNSAAAGDGDIDVNTRIRWSSGNNLTLTADRDINLRQNLEASAQSDITLQAGTGGSGTVNMSAGRQIITIGGAVAVQGTRVTLQRVTTRASGTVAGGGNVTVNAGTGGVELIQQIDTRASNTLNGAGGTVNVTASGDIAINRNIDTSGYTGNAGSISLTSTGGTVSTGDSAALRARGLAGSDGGTVTLRADAGSVIVGAAAGNGTRIVTRASGSGSTGDGGDIVLSARTVTLNRGINANGSGGGNGGDVTVTASADNATTRNIITRGGTTAGSGGNVTVSASGDIAATRNIDTSTYTNDAGTITMTSTNGTISTGDSAALRALGLNGGNGGAVSLRADNGAIALGATAGNGTRIDTRGLGTGAAGSGGAVSLAAQTITLNRDINASGSAGGNGGDITLAATAGTTDARNVITRGGTAAGAGGTVNVTAAGDITVSRSIDTSGYTGNAGNIALTSTAGAITTGDSTALRARGLRGGNGGTVTLRADSGNIAVGATASNATRIETRSAGSGSTGNGGNILLSARAVTLKRGVNANGGAGGNGGNITVTATAGTAATRNMVTRGGTTTGIGGTVIVTASGDVAISRNIDTSGYTGDAGTITVSSTSGAISTDDSAALLARGLRGGNGNAVNLRANNGNIALGATVGNGTRIDTRGLGTGASGNGGEITMAARTITLNRNVNASGSIGGDGGNITVAATAGTATTRSIITRGGTTAGGGGTVSITSSANLTANSGVDTSGYTGNAGNIVLTSTAGAIATSDSAALRARGLRGSNGGAITLRADNGAVTLGATAGNGTRIETRSAGTNSTGSGGDVILRGTSVILNRDVSANGGQRGAGGNVTITASSGTATTRGIVTRGGTVTGLGGNVSIAARDDIDVTGRIDTSGYAGNAGPIAMSSTNGAIGTRDNAALRALGLRGGGGGGVTLRADNGGIVLGTTAGNGTRIDSRSVGAGSTGDGGDVSLDAQTITLNRNINTSGGAGGNGGSVTVTASSGTAAIRAITSRGGTTAGNGGNIVVGANGNLVAAGNIDTSAYTGNAGAITLTSDTASITTSDGTTLSARGLRGGNGGSVALQAGNGTINVGTTVGPGTRIYTRSHGAGSTGNGGDISITASTVVVNQDVNATGGAAGNGGNVRVTATAGNVTTRHVVTRSGSVSGQAGRLTIAAAGNVTTAGTLRAGVTQITAPGAISVSVAAGSLLIGGDSAAVVGSIAGQSGNGAVGQLQIDNTDIPNPCTVNGFACILPPPAVGPATVAAVSVSADVAALTAAIDQAGTPLALRVADQETPAQEAFVQSPLIGAVPADVFSGGYQLVRTPSIVPAAGRAEPADEAGEKGEEEEERLDSIVPSAGPAPEDDAVPTDAVPTAEVDAYFTQDLWSGLRNP